VGKTTLIKALAFGTEKTYQSWNGLEDLDILKNDRTFNTGIYTDEFGKTRFTIMKPIIISKIITSCIGMKNYPTIGIQI
jgi:hypothetical protein